MFLPGKFYGQRSLVGYSPCGYKELHTTDWLSMCTSEEVESEVRPRSHACASNSTGNWGTDYRKEKSLHLDYPLFCPPSTPRLLLPISCALPHPAKKRVPDPRQAVRPSPEGWLSYTYGTYDGDKGSWFTPLVVLWWEGYLVLTLNIPQTSLAPYCSQVWFFSFPLDSASQSAFQ